MENEYLTHKYTQKDLDKAFYMGLEAAVVVLENTAGLSLTAQGKVIEELKTKINKSKIDVAMTS